MTIYYISNFDETITNKIMKTLKFVRKKIDYKLVWDLCCELQKVNIVKRKKWFLASVEYLFNIKIIKTRFAFLDDEPIVLDEKLFNSKEYFNSIRDRIITEGEDGYRDDIDFE